MKLWEGRFKTAIDKKTNDFNSSISFDQRMYKQDITGSKAHAKMLGECGIIKKSEADKIITTLDEILTQINENKLEIDQSAEDIHSFVEAQLTQRIGETGKRLHTARSRNDQVALDLILYLNEKCSEIEFQLVKMLQVLAENAGKYNDYVMPGYTHLQRAQPITFGHHLMAYAAMFERDLERIKQTKARMCISPLGNGALAGTTYPLDRMMVANELGLLGITNNSLDGVSNRDFVLELMSDISIIMVHLSRFSEEVILWCSWEFKFIELDDAFSTGSSIMPQKKNPDIAELVRGKSGRVFGDLMAMLTTMKGLPLAYNKDMQEDKEAVFDSVDTVLICLDTFSAMLASISVNKENMRNAALKGFINATDAADFLVNKGLAFRDAYKIVGSLVSYCIENEKTLESITLKEYKEFSSSFDESIYEAISLENCVNKRTVVGGPAPVRVLKEVKKLKEKIKALK